MPGEPDMPPFTRRDGRLHLEDVDLTDLSGALDGRAAWLVSHAAVEMAIAGVAGSSASAGVPAPSAERSALRAAPESMPYSARCIAVAAVGPLAVLGQIAASGWWAAVRSSHELTLALEAGFPPERLLAGGGVRDDGFVKDALAAGVAVMRHADDEQRANAARIAALLGHELPPEHGAPPAAPAGLLTQCGGLLAPVLRAPPALAIDAVCPRLAASQPVLALHTAPPAAADSLLAPGAGGLPAPGVGALIAAVAGTLAGLDAGDAPQAALVPPHVQRGEWVVLPGAAADVLPVDPAHPAARTVLVRGASWRLLPARPLPPEMD